MITIFWAGDSTVKAGGADLWPQTGIGEAFARYIQKDNVRIENCAENNRSTKSFIAEGRLDAIAERIAPGDFLFVQFGHNDEKHVDPARYTDPDTTFRENLARFAGVARSRGATPVFITPAARYHAGDASEVYRHVRWRAAMLAEGERLGVTVIDLTGLSETLVQHMGPAAATALYMNLPGGVSPCFPRGQRDNTHLQPAGAMAFARLIARELRALGGKYAALLREAEGGKSVEIWDLYTRERQSTGETHVRGEKMPPERYHLVVHVWIRDREGRWLISQRSANRPMFPLKWETVGGSVTAGEDSLTAALREVEEEIGVQLDMENGTFLGSVVREESQSIRDDWVFVYNGPIDLARATTDEVAQIRWMTVKEIRVLYDAGELVHTLAYFFDDPMQGENA